MLKNYNGTVLSYIMLVSSILMLILGFVLFIIFTFNRVYFNVNGIIDPQLASNFGNFIGGLIGTIFGITSTLLLLLNLSYQRIIYQKKTTEENYFRMVDYHYQNINNLKIHEIKVNKYGEYVEVFNRRAFVIFKLQLTHLLRIVSEINNAMDKKIDEKSIIDIAYIAFYYGVSEELKDFLIDKLKKYEEREYIVKNLVSAVNKCSLRIGRTNQTSLSVYFRNMYNAIKYIDEDNVLSDNEKKKYIDIFQAQLSNPELFILFFNIVSTLGKKWKEKDYVMKYSFLKNIPLGYLGEYDQRKYFELRYEENKLN